MKKIFCFLFIAGSLLPVALKAQTLNSLITAAKDYTNANIVTNNTRQITPEKLNIAVNKIIDALYYIDTVGSGIHYLQNGGDLGDSILVNLNDSTFLFKNLVQGTGVLFTITDSTIKIDNAGTLQIATDNGNTTTNDIKIANSKYFYGALVGGAYRKLAGIDNTGTMRFGTDESDVNTVIRAWNDSIKLGDGGIVYSAAIHSFEGKIMTGTGNTSASVTINENSSGITQSDSKGMLLKNNTAAANNAQQISPAINWGGYGWKTNASAASQAVNFRAYMLPVQGTASPSGLWKLQSAINGGAYSDIFTVSTSGDVTVAGLLNVAIGSYIPSVIGGTGTNSSLLLAPTDNATAGSGAEIIFNVGNFAAVNAMNIKNTGVINTPLLTASLPLKLDASKNIVSAAINLSGSEVTGDLPFANLTQGSARSFIGVTGNATADVASIQGTANQIARINGAGTALAFGSIDLAQSAAVGSSVLPLANGGTNSTDGTGLPYVPIVSGVGIANNMIHTTENKSSTFNAVAGYAYILGEVAGAEEISLPSTPVNGDIIKFYYPSSGAGTWVTTTSFTKVDGSTSTSIIVDSMIEFQWDSANEVWRAVINL